ncbi:unnamed protein product [Strongylus vulgaris]|uniref:Uncharacterized protein n=1 Tax=Strongylus vulgaris TaxID=40348 RepID=A0A3P7JBX7_STRVU|nr:unnamed protein product [Strongylus vulgaris]
MTIQTKPIVTGGLPLVKLTETDREFLDPSYLSGSYRYYDLIISNTTATRSPSGLDVAKTVFGPTIYGPGQIDNTNNTTALICPMTAVCQCSYSDSIQKLFELENMGITSIESNADEGT